MRTPEENKILLALQRYYLGDITFERVAYDAGVTLNELINYIEKKDLRVILTDQDRVEGIKKIHYLMERRGLKSALKISEESYRKLKSASSA